MDQEHPKKQEILYVKNFITISEATIDIEKFTILIGPQSSGKSILAKLVYYFRDFLVRDYVYSIKDQADKRALTRNGIDKFEKLFPPYVWENQNFLIEYIYDDVKVTVARNTESTKRKPITLDYSDNLAQIHRRAKSCYRKKIDEIQSDDLTPISYDYDRFWEIIDQNIFSSSIGGMFVHTTFIPASRSFFANLQRNVFSFLANNLSIDPLIKEFGSVYERSKRALLHARFPKKTKDEHEKIKSLMEIVVKGKYLFEDDQDWIVSDIGKVNLSNASSGQQESLPMLLVLLYYANWTKRRKSFVIEEPEAHLFPYSQKVIMELLARIHNYANCEFFVTTHSPYILTALNNFILASSIGNDDNLSAFNKERLEKRVSRSAWISYENVAAYTIDNGKASSIMDHEMNLIGTSVIDSVSDQFDELFSELLMIERNDAESKIN